MNAKHLVALLAVFGSFCLPRISAEEQALEKLTLQNGGYCEQISEVTARKDSVKVRFAKGDRIRALANYGGGRILGNVLVTEESSAQMAKESEGKGYFESVIPFSQLTEDLQRRFNYHPAPVTVPPSPKVKDDLGEHPFRTISGKTYDFSKVIAWIREENTLRMHNPYTSEQKAYLDKSMNYSARLKAHYAGRSWNDWHVRGKVISVSDEGALLNCFISDGTSDGGSYVVKLLKHYPRQMVDGDFVACAAMPVGVFKYNNAMGGTSTVKAYDYGTPANPDEQGAATPVLEP